MTRPAAITAQTTSLNGGSIGFVGRGMDGVKRWLWVAVPAVDPKKQRQHQQNIGSTGGQQLPFNRFCTMLGFLAYQKPTADRL